MNMLATCILRVTTPSLAVELNLYCLLSRKLNEIKLQLFKMYLLLLFRFYLLQTVEQAASPATKKMKPEGKWKLLSC